MGTKLNMHARKNTERRDDNQRHYAVEIVRKIIYEQGFGVESAAVDALLADKSWVPTRVSDT